MILSFFSFSIGWRDSTSDFKMDATLDGANDIMFLLINGRVVKISSVLLYLMLFNSSAYWTQYSNFNIYFCRLVIKWSVNCLFERKIDEIIKEIIKTFNKDK